MTKISDVFERRALSRERELKKVVGNWSAVCSTNNTFRNIRYQYLHLDKQKSKEIGLDIEEL